jgi:hypothetical protein
MRVLIILTTLISCFKLTAQVESTDAFKLSILTDGLLINNTTEWVNDIELNHRFSNRILDSCTILGRNYYLSFQIEYLNVKNLDYKILHFKSIDSSNTSTYENKIDVYFRLYGYRENDFTHFYNRVLKYYWKESDIASRLESYRLKDSVFSTIDFVCLVNTIKKNQREENCMHSFAAESFFQITKSTGNNSLNDSQYQTEKKFAYFSNRQFYGNVPLNFTFSQHKKYIRKMNKIRMRLKKGLKIRKFKI